MRMVEPLRTHRLERGDGKAGKARQFAKRMTQGIKIGAASVPGFQRVGDVGCIG